jgi:quercetin dioxygenase-like cupin family protein
VTESARVPLRLTPEPDPSTPPGVAMWLLERGKALPGHCPVSAARFSVQPGAESELDVHEVVEVWTVTSGRGVILSGDREVEVTEGDSVFFDRNVPHLLRNRGTDPVAVFSIWWSKAVS